MSRNSRMPYDAADVRSANRLKPNQDDTMDPYATHLAPLVACIRHTQGAVIELGCGDYSTPILHHLCPGRLLVSADSNRAWLGRFADLACDMHILCHVPDW